MAEQLEFFPVPTPCRGLCQVNQRGYCLGCWRSREERFQWLNLSDGQKRQVLALCRQRQYRETHKASSEPDTVPPQPSLF